MKVQLTDRFCDRVKPVGVQIDYVDQTCQGLSLRVSKHGIKSWNLLYTANGKACRLTLGRYPEVSLAGCQRQGP
jgi:hypothetical protein